MTDVRRLGRVGNIINTQTVDVICQVSVSTQHDHIIGDSAWGKSAVVGVSDVDGDGRVGNIVNAQAVSAVRQVSMVARDDDAVRIATVVRVTDINRIDLSGNGDHPTKRADEGEERPQNASHSFHGASRLDVAKTSCIKGRCLALLVQNTGAAQSMLRAMNGRMWRMTREVKEIPGLLSAQCLCATPTAGRRRHPENSPPAHPAR